MGDETRRFDGLAQDYARFRPGYPPALVGRLRAERGLRAEAHVVDVGCGTGLLAEAFLDAGCRVTGVDPSAPMRAQAQSRLAGRAGFACRAGTAEDSALPAGCADAIVAGQAFHWFDVPRAAAEFARLLRPEGWVALVWNDRLDPGQPFLVEYEGLLHEHCAAYGPRLRGASGDERTAAFFGAGRTDAGAMRTLVLPNPQRLDWAGLAGRTRSASYVPREGPAREALFRDLRRLFERCARGGRVDFALRTIAYHGRPA